MDEMLGAAYLNNQFDLGLARGELSGWKKKVQRLSNDYSVLHRDWHERGVVAVTWRKIAEDLYKKYYKKYDKEHMRSLYLAKEKEVSNNFTYDPHQRPEPR
jgi:hypothetical protein